MASIRERGLTASFFCVIIEISSNKGLKGIFIMPMEQNDIVAKRRDDLHKQYDHLMDLYKFYWTTSLRVSGFYVITIGAALSFYATNIKTPNTNLIPLFCSIFSLFFCFLSLYGGIRVGDITDWFARIAGENQLDFVDWPTSEPLQFFLYLNALLDLAVGCISAYLYWPCILCVIIYVAFIVILYSQFNKICLIFNKIRAFTLPTH
jgi:hypothetical protein